MTDQRLRDRTTVEFADRAPQQLVDAGGRVARELTSSIDAGFPAGGTVVVADAGGELLRITAGWACTVDERIPTSAATVYDLASLTKVVSTVTLALALTERGLWQLDDPAARWLPGFPNREITLRRLLTHTSGLPAHRKFYLMPGGPSAIRTAIYAEAAGELTPGAVCYSDLGFMLLGWALEQCAGQPLDALFREVVAQPLQMSGTHFRPSPEERRLTAATELDGDQRLEPGLVWGTVHDGNAWALGGVAGHAGLFGPAEDLVRFATALLEPSSHPVLSAASLAEMTRRQAGEPPDIRALGWRLDASEWGPWPPGSFWHTGFTGGSLLIAPEVGLAVVSLLGAVHPKREPDLIGGVRSAIHQELADALI